MLRAIKSGRLKQSLQIGPDGKAKIVDVALADAEWAVNTDHSKAPGSVKERANGTGRAARGVQPSALAEASAEEKRWKARQAELDYRLAAGELVRVAAVTQLQVDEVLRAKAKVLAVPSKFKARSPHLSAADIRLLDQLLREALEELAADPPPEGAS